MDKAINKVLIIAGTTTLAVGAGIGLIGFGPGGVALGSIAAGIQAGIGNVAAGSFFAKMTAFGMTGGAIKTVTCGAVVATTGFFNSYFNSSKGSNADNNSKLTDLTITGEAAEATEATTGALALNTSKDSNSDNNSESTYLSMTGGAIKAVACGALAATTTALTATTGSLASVTGAFSSYFNSGKDSNTVDNS